MTIARSQGLGCPAIFQSLRLRIGCKMHQPSSKCDGITFGKELYCDDFIIRSKGDG
jgi:hypothetical protein